MLFGQKIQAYQIILQTSLFLKELTRCRNLARQELFQEIQRRGGKVSIIKLENMMEYFTIFPNDMDPAGIVPKIKHIFRLQQHRMRQDLQALFPEIEKSKLMNIENLLEIAITMNLIFKIFRHLYLLSKKTKNIYYVMQLGMLVPLLQEEVAALMGAIPAFKSGTPIGDGIGPMVVAKLMQDRKTIAEDTVYSVVEHKGRKLLVVKAEGPGGTVGEVGEAVQNLVSHVSVLLESEKTIQVKTIIMIDAALKFEGERSGSVAEGVGAAIGGIGVEKYAIEEIATRYAIPLYAIVVRQSEKEAINRMKAEIEGSVDTVLKALNNLIENKTQPGDTVIVVGVGNTIGVP